MAMIHACLLRNLLDEVDPDDHVKFARRFGEVASQVLDPLYDVTQWYDQHRFAELDADAAGTPYRTDEMSITLAPGEGAEIKAQMAAGQRLVYSWTASGNGVDVDMHGEAIGKTGCHRR